MYEATLVVDESLLEAISLKAKPSFLIAQLDISKYIETVKGFLLF